MHTDVKLMAVNFEKSLSELVGASAAVSAGIGYPEPGMASIELSFAKPKRNTPSCREERPMRPADYYHPENVQCARLRSGRARRTDKVLKLLRDSIRGDDVAAANH